MTKIHPEALAAWDSADERARRAVLAHAVARARRAYDEEERGGQASKWCPPTVETTEVIEARLAPHLIATLVTSHRVYHYAQSGSDWSTQTVVISEVSYDGLVSERIVYARAFNVSEGDSDDHDDAVAVQEQIEYWRDAIRRAVEHVRKHVAESVHLHSGGWPITHVFEPDITVLEVGQRDGSIVVTTCTSIRIDLAAQAGSDYAKRVVEIDETTVFYSRLATRTVVERNDQRGEYEDFDSKEFEREAIDAWRARYHDRKPDS